MRFELTAPPPMDLFYKTVVDDREYYFLNKKLRRKSKELYVKTFKPTENLSTNFYIGGVTIGDYCEDPTEIVGYMFFSILPVLNLTTSVISYSGSWRELSPSISLKGDDTILKYRSSDFFLYHVLGGKASMVAVPDLNDKLHDFLTMI